jgi:hypothetical protein
MISGSAVYSRLRHEGECSPDAPAPIRLGVQSQCMMAQILIRSAKTCRRFSGTSPARRWLTNKSRESDNLAGHSFD